MKLSMRKTYNKNGEVKNNGYTANIPKAFVFEAFGEKLSLKVCNEHAGDLAYILRLMW